MNRTAIGAVAALLVAIVFAAATLFTVGQTEQALVTEFGRPVRVVEQAGLHARTPFVQSVIGFDRRLLALTTPPEEVILGDQRRLIVDSFTMYRISDALRFYQAAGASGEAVEGRLNAIVSSAIRRVLGTRTLPDVLSADRDRIMTSIRQQVDGEMRGFGVTVEDVRIRRADLPRENTEAILSRMQSERERIAAQARAEGAATSARIRADAERDRTVLLAEARAQADKLRGEGEASATKLYADAYGKDPGFYATWRTLEAYRAAFDTGKARLVLSPDGDFLRLLTQPPGDTVSALVCLSALGGGEGRGESADIARDVVADVRLRSIQRRAQPFGIRRVVSRAVDRVARQVGEDRSGAGQARAGYAAVGVPQLGAHHRLRTLEINPLDVDHHHRTRQLALRREARQQSGIDRDDRAAVHPQRLANSGDQKQAA